MGVGRAPGEQHIYTDNCSKDLEPLRWEKPPNLEGQFKTLVSNDEEPLLLSRCDLSIGVTLGLTRRQSTMSDVKPSEPRAPDTFTRSHL